ncbi:DUF4177 domain-containing protein [bacterium]|nr:DUF4177 domain-containing protein [bacterium]
MSNHARLLSLLLLFALALGLHGRTAVADEPRKDAPSKATPKWEYKSLQMGLWVKTSDMDKAFNELGEQGWEMVTSNFTVQPVGGGVTNYVFKRPKR